VNHGRLNAGVRIGRPFLGGTNGGTPWSMDRGLAYLDIGGIYDFAGEDNILVAVSTTNLFAQTSNLGGNLGAGVDLTLRNGTSFRLSADAILLGDYNALRGFAKVTVPIR
jgi:hypothetical protein